MSKPRDATDNEWYDFDTRLRGVHLKGREIIVTIRAVIVEETHPQPGKPGVDTPVLYMEKTNKGLVLSPRNRNKLAELFGPKVGSCIGKRIKLRAEPLKVGNHMTLPIYIEAAPNGSAAPAPVATLDAETGELIEPAKEQPEA